MADGFHLEHFSAKDVLLQASLLKRRTVYLAGPFLATLKTLFLGAAFHAAINIKLQQYNPPCL